ERDEAEGAGDDYLAGEQEAEPRRLRLVGSFAHYGTLHPSLPFLTTAVLSISLRTAVVHGSTAMPRLRTLEAARFRASDDRHARSRPVTERTGVENRVW